MDVSDPRPELEWAHAALIEARSLQHTLAVKRVEEKATAAANVLGVSNRAAQHALTDSWRRRHTMLGAVALCLFGAAIVSLRRRQVIEDLPPVA